MNNDCYDYVITGAGASGLSLAYHLNQIGLTNKRILLIDKQPKTENDRTWCFWEQGENAFESVVFRRWEHVAFHGHDFSQTLDLAPYAYKMIRGVDFYRFMSRWLDQQPNVEQQFGTVSDIKEDADGVIVRVDGQAIRGQWAFNSIQFKPQPKRRRYHYLLQHFKGWVIHTPDKRFDPSVATLMDFRVEQQDDTRFSYVLPFDEHTALVEYTVFSPSLLPQEEYTRQLERYIRDQLRITNYEEQHEEFGVIPMTDAPCPKQLSPHVINIGTAGGRTKPSTGYTFLRVQRQSKQIAEALRNTGTPYVTEPVMDWRYRLYDSALLNVLDQHRYPGKRVFTDLFQRNPAQLVFKFLDQETTLAEDLRVMSSVNISQFSLATLNVLARRLSANSRE